MKLTANITLDELTKSQVAERKGINNNPNPTQIENLKALAVNILQPVRSEFDKPLIISSGFRCAELCIEIGSKITSEHCADNKSAAADFEIPGIGPGSPFSGFGKPQSKLPTPPLPQTPQPQVQANTQQINPISGLTRSQQALLSPQEQVIAQKKI